MPSAIEQELIEACEFDPPRKYDDRQDHLAALARAINKIKDVDFDALSVDAAEWFNDAVRALKEKRDIPEFGDFEEEANADPDEEAAEEAAPEKPKPKPEPAKRRAKGVPPRKLEHPPIDASGIETAELDKWGIVKGSKNSAAAAMLETGCRMSDITHSIGGTYYNLVERLRKAGHSIEKGSNGSIKLVHKDG